MIVREKNINNIIYKKTKIYIIGVRNIYYHIDFPIWKYYCLMQIHDFLNNNSIYLDAKQPNSSFIP